MAELLVGRRDVIAELRAQALADLSGRQAHP
jgi:hypothetical protein